MLFDYNGKPRPAELLLREVALSCRTETAEDHFATLPLDGIDDFPM